MKHSDNAPPANDDTAMHVVFLVVHAFAFSLVVFFRSRFGRRYGGMQGLVAGLILMFWPELNLRQDPRPVALFLFAYLAAAVSARCGQGWRVITGKDAYHTRYSGLPRLCRLFPRVPEATVKRFLEPLVAFGIGLVATHFNSLLGEYLLIAAIALFFTENFAARREAERAMDLRDAFIDATGRAPEARPTIKYIPRQVR